MANARKEQKPLREVLGRLTQIEESLAVLHTAAQVLLLALHQLAPLQHPPAPPAAARCPLCSPQPEEET